MCYRKDKIKTEEIILKVRRLIMGKIRNIIKEDILKVLGSSTFWLAVLATALILITGTIGTYENNEKFNIIELVTSHSRSEISSTIECDVISTIYNGSSSYIWMFMPVLAGMPLIPLLCAERKNRAMRYELFRVSKFKFAVGKLFSAMISGGMVLSIAYLVFSLVIFIGLPQKGNLQDIVDNSLLIEISYAGYWKVVEKLGLPFFLITKFMMVFLYGALSSLVAYVLSSFVTNKYIVLCAPFIVNYMVTMAVDKYGSTPMSYEHPNNPFNLIIGSLTTTSGLRLCDLPLKNAIYFICVWTVLIALSMGIYVFIVNRRCDCGQ